MSEANNILVISGKKQSGKNTLATYIQAKIFVEHDLIGTKFEVKDGELWYDPWPNNNSWADFNNLRNKPLIKVSQSDLINIPDWMGIHCRQYSFASPVKDMLCNIMGVSKKNVWG